MLPGTIGLSQTEKESRATKETVLSALPVLFQRDDDSESQAVKARRSRKAAKSPAFAEPPSGSETATSRAAPPVTAQIEGTFPILVNTKVAVPASATRKKAASNGTLLGKVARRRVPAGDPSVRQSSVPWAAKTTEPASAGVSSGNTTSGSKGPTALSRRVPAAVPSLLQTCEESSRSTTREPPTATNGPEKSQAVHGTGRKAVDSGLPSVLQRPWWPRLSSAKKKVRPLACATRKTLVSNGSPVAKSVIRRVPAGVPSLLHSSWPCTMSLATKKTRPPATWIASSLKGDEGANRVKGPVPAAVPSLAQSSYPDAA